MAYRVRKLPENEKIGYIEWEDQAVTISADEALAQIQAEHQGVDETALWIRDLLSGGRLPANPNLLPPGYIPIYKSRACLRRAKTRCRRRANE